jgi:hypothetical protein
MPVSPARRKKKKLEEELVRQFHHTNPDLKNLYLRSKRNFTDCSWGLIEGGFGVGTWVHTHGTSNLCHAGENGRTRDALSVLGLLSLATRSDTGELTIVIMGKKLTSTVITGDPHAPSGKSRFVGQRKSTQVEMTKAQATLAAFFLMIKNG